MSSSSFAAPNNEFNDRKNSRIDNPLDHEVEDIANMQFRTEQAGEDFDGRVSIVSCDSRDLQLIHE